MIRTVGLYTLGCKVSQYETEAVAEAFASSGFIVCGFEEFNDVYVINTCTVTEESDRKSRQFIRRAIRKNPEAVIIVMGCYSQRDPKAVSEIEGVSAVIGTHGKLRAVEVAQGLLSGELTAPVIMPNPLASVPFEPMTVNSAPRTRAYVKIEDGCDSKCTYCAIKEARGPIRSKAPEDVIREVEALAADGTLEVVLTGIETAAYGKDFDEKYGLCDLLLALDRRNSCKRIRLGSLAPELVGEEFAGRVSSLGILVPHFHISVQSGADSVLRRMKRRYTSASALENINRIRELIPEAQFTADIMVGFPGESEEDFLATADFVRKARFLDAHVFTFSPRAGTPAAEFSGQIPKAEKHERTTRLIAIKNEVRDSVLCKLVERKKPLSCIFESEEAGLYTAHSDSFAEVVATSDTDVRGMLLSVRPVSSKDGKIFGEIIKM